MLAVAGYNNKTAWIPVLGGRTIEDALSLYYDGDKVVYVGQDEYYVYSDGKYVGSGIISGLKVVK